MTRKGFFQERTAKEIMEFDPKKLSSPRGLVGTLESASFDDAYELRFRLTPGEYFRNVENSAEASRRHLKHGAYIKLDQPSNLQEALEGGIPLDYRAATLSKFETMREEDANFLGFYFTPVAGTRDMRKRMHPFYIGPEGARIFAYSEKLKAGVKNKDSVGIRIMPYDEALRVVREGENVVFEVSSREKGKGRFRGRMVNFPIEPATDRTKNPRAIIWGFKTEYERMPENKLWNFRYTGVNSRETSDVIFLQPQDLAAYITGAGEYWKQAGNIMPMMMNPFAISSERQARFYNFIRNNVVIFDPTLKKTRQNPAQTRKLHLDEICVLLGRQLIVAGHDQTMFWDWETSRDRKLKDYDWSIPGSNLGGGN